MYSHEDSQRTVFAPCGKKISFEKVEPENFCISGKVESLIKKFVNENFNFSDNNFPLSICRTCYLTLLDHVKSTFCNCFQGHEQSG